MCACVFVCARTHVSIYGGLGLFGVVCVPLLGVSVLCHLGVCVCVCVY
ncbi:MAG: hypothetical protein P4L40_01465 [Terracidiphilus sp.]|nr:hypothetical protein [Terracidiphilus sp.]